MDNKNSQQEINDEAAKEREELLDVLKEMKFDYIRCVL